MNPRIYCARFYSAMVVVRSEGVLACSFFLMVCLSFLNADFARAASFGKVDVKFDSPSFSREFTRAEIREVFSQLIKKRSFLSKRTQITLKGSPAVCNVIFEFFDGVIFQKEPASQRSKTVDASASSIDLNPSDLIEIPFQSLRGRIPVGNLLLLVRDRLKWPVSVVVKDLEIKLSVNAFAKIATGIGSLRIMKVVASGNTSPTDLGIVWKKEKNNEFLVKQFYEKGISLAVRRQAVYLKNISDSSFMILSGRVPGYLGALELHLIGRPVAIPGGLISFKAQALVLGGKVQFETPLLKIAEGEFGDALNSFTCFLNEAFKIANYAEEVIVDDEVVTIKGIGLISLLDCVRGRQAEKWYSSRPSVEPSLLLNRLH